MSSSGSSYDSWSEKSEPTDSPRGPPVGPTQAECDAARSAAAAAAHVELSRALLLRFAHRDDDSDHAKGAAAAALSRARRPPAMDAVLLSLVLAKANLMLEGVLEPLAERRVRCAPAEAPRPSCIPPPSPRLDGFMADQAARHAPPPPVVLTDSETEDVAMAALALLSTLAKQTKLMKGIVSAETADVMYRIVRSTESDALRDAVTALLGRLGHVHTRRGGVPNVAH